MPLDDPKPLNLLAPPSAANKAMRSIWQIIYFILYRPSPVPLFAWRRFLLRCFGSKLDKTAKPYPSARVWAPWNLIMEPSSCLAPGTNCYNVTLIVLGENSTVSQETYLCSASHNFHDPQFQLSASEIVIKSGAWVAAQSFIGPGVTIGERAVVGARSVVTKSVPEDTIVAGNPAKAIGKRRLPSAQNI